MSKITQNPSQRAVLTRRAALGRIAKFSAILPSLLLPSASKWNAPAPKFNFGDRVSLSFLCDGEIATQEGTVQGAVYCPENLSLEHQSGKGWFYAIHWQNLFNPTFPDLVNQIDTSCLEPEAELRRA